MKTIVMLLFAMLLVVSGCAVSPAGKELKSSAYSVGDYASVQLGETVLSIQQGERYRNLHIELAAVVNPRNTTFDYSFGEVERIVQRLSPRIAGRLIEVITDMTGPGVGDLRVLQGKIRNEAQVIVDTNLKQWKHGSEYQVEVVIVALYFTDGTVGCTGQRNRLW
jgi:hypothetical protein